MPPSQRGPGEALPASPSVAERPQTGGRRGEARRGQACPALPLSQPASPAASTARSSPRSSPHQAGSGARQLPAAPSIPRLPQALPAAAAAAAIFPALPLPPSRPRTGATGSRSAPAGGLALDDRGGGGSGRQLGALPGRRRGGPGRWRCRGPGWGAMLTKFETKSARVKGNGGTGLGLCWEPLRTRGGRAGSSRPRPGSRGGGEDTAPPGLLRASGLPGARRPRCHVSPCLGRAQLSPQAAVDPHQPAQWRHPAVGLSDVHPHRQIR